MVSGPHHIRFSQQRAIDVAGSTGTRCSLENAVFMTRLTCSAGVHTRQHETGFDVIEIPPSLAHGIGKPKRQHQRQKPLK
jgi:hypothetical protein